MDYILKLIFLLIYAVTLLSIKAQTFDANATASMSTSQTDVSTKLSTSPRTTLAETANTTTSQTTRTTSSTTPGQTTSSKPSTTAAKSSVTPTTSHLTTDRGSSVVSASFTTDLSSIKVTTTRANNRTITTSTSTGQRNGTSFSTTESSTDDTLSGETITADTSETSCLSTIVLVAGFSGIFCVCVLIGSCLLILRMRKKWRKKLREERLKTDIWTMSTFNNTIVNDNFMDYKLATPPPDERRRETFFTDNSAFHPTASFSSHTSDYVHESNNRAIRKPMTTSSSDSNLSGPMKAWVKRSSVGSEVLLNQSNESRSRTSSFMSARKDLRNHDKHVLVRHEELHTSQEELDNPQTYMHNPGYCISQNQHIVTEL